MTFYMDGPNAHERMTLEQVLKNRIVEKVEATVPERGVDEDEHRAPQAQQSHQYRALDNYETIGALPQAHEVVVAEQVMSSPVVVLSSDAVVADALLLFREREIRHLPIISAQGALVGMVSEREILHHLGGVSGRYQRQAQRGWDESMGALMRSPVLTASPDTDVRYIARLFVERRIGALPIVTHGELKGIIVRSDILKAVMRYFVLELWA